MMIGAVALAIVGGFIPADQQFVVAFASQSAKLHHCSGALVAPDVVLTARHCIENSPGAPFEVRFSNGESIHVSSTYFPVSGDSALAYLEEKSGVQPAPVLFNYVGAGSPIYLSGWGLPSYALKSCSSTVSWTDPGSYINYPEFVSAPCGPAAHDSGGPILARVGAEWRVVGNIVSTWYGMNMTRYFDDPAYFAVYQEPIGECH
jgi:hypothetical protein